MEDLATIRRIKLEQCVQLATFQTDATQVGTKSIKNRASIPLTTLDVCVHDDVLVVNQNFYQMK